VLRNWQFAGAEPCAAHSVAAPQIIDALGAGRAAASPKQSGMDD